MAVAERDRMSPSHAQEIAIWAIRRLTFLMSSLKHKQMASDDAERKDFKSEEMSFGKADKFSI